MEPLSVLLAEFYFRYHLLVNDLAHLIVDLAHQLLPGLRDTNLWCSPWVVSSVHDAPRVDGVRASFPLCILLRTRCQTLSLSLVSVHTWESLLEKLIPSHGSLLHLSYVCRQYILYHLSWLLMDCLW